MMSGQPVYFTTPIYYVNDKPHFGSAYTTIAGDVLARASRLLGHPSYYLTGTDEHGAKVAESAAEENLTPQALTDRNSALYIEAWKALEVANDDFIRTTSERHKRGVEKFLNALHDARTPSGDPAIYAGEYRGKYCTGCEKFLTDRDLVDGRCPLHPDRVPNELVEKNYFFRLSAYIEEVERRITDDAIRIRPETRRREVLGLFKVGLDDFSISREKLAWGIPLPFDPSQRTYVWVDALPNYITAIGYADDPAMFDRWWNSARIVHLMAKDILKFHTIYWPAMLIAAGIKPPDVMYIHGYATVDGQKMSKSLRNSIDPLQLSEQFGVDGFRYLSQVQFSFGQDGDVKQSEFVRQFNADLANDVGNLVSRCVKLLIRHFDGARPTACELTDGDKALQQTGERLIADYRTAIDANTPDVAIAAALDYVRATNRYFEHSAPWKLAKEGKTARLGAVLITAAEAIRQSAVMLFPIVPDKARAILRALGFSNPDDELVPAALTDWDRCPGPFALDEPIFPRLDERAAKAAAPSPTEADDGIITIDDFAHVQLKTATVVEASRVENADRLLRLQIEIGDQKRQIVAGIAEHYEPEALVGRTICVVANLKPTKIRGIESKGMLLAAKKGKTLRLVTADGDIPSGASIS